MAERLLAVSKFVTKQKKQFFSLPNVSYRQSPGNESVNCDSKASLSSLSARSECLIRPLLSSIAFDRNFTVQAAVRFRTRLSYIIGVRIDFAGGADSDNARRNVNKTPPGPTADKHCVT
ncbi:hypothetical protein EVAR_9884_1 [Eumeta japonica]|uniref:Uncharacterized protein n=1 Tax=Eumeta variegata TaxID=151549 RepID=A0A4C1TQC3_EUMVA|nr:hypothetical protein EVAR_9884_1 [Eumeta japonica]